jgi:hypothetical protein
MRGVAFDQNTPKTDVSGGSKFTQNRDEDKEHAGVGSSRFLADACEARLTVPSPMPSSTAIAAQECP